MGHPGDPPRIEVAEHDDHVTVWLNRPETRNAIDQEMVSALHEVCAALEARPRVLVLMGRGPVFASGADIRELRERSRFDALRGINSGLFQRIATLPLPTVAAINGPAIGGGAELAYAFDFRLATPTTRFANPEAQLGILPGAGACWRLRELVGVALAREMLLAGRAVDAKEALAAGLVNEVVEADDLLAAVGSLVARMASADPLALQLTKLVMAAPAGAHPRMDDVAQAILFETDEKRRRMTAFLERRPQ